MLLSMLKSKLHRAVVTSCMVDYQGSIAIDLRLMKAVNLLPYEKVLVANLMNGNRFETYAIPAQPGSGVICLNGAAALLGSPGDRIIIMAFAMTRAAQARKHRPLVIALDSKNRPTGEKKKNKRLR